MYSKELAVGAEARISEEILSGRARERLTEGEDDPLLVRNGGQLGARNLSPPNGHSPDHSS